MHGHSKTKNLRGPLKAMAMKNIILLLGSTLLLGGSGGMPPQEIFEK